MNQTRGLILLALLLWLPVAVAAGETVSATVSSQSSEPVADPDGRASSLDSPWIRQVAARVVHHRSTGNTTHLLSLTLEIDNSSADELTMEPDDLRILTAFGTLLTAPEIRQDGVGSQRIRVAPGTGSLVELLFELVSEDPWSAFTFSWGARLADGTRAGQIEFLRSLEGFEVPGTALPESTRATTGGGQPVRSVHTVGYHGCPGPITVQPDVWQFHVFSGWPGVHAGPDAPWPTLWGAGLGTSFCWTDARSIGAGCPGWSDGSRPGGAWRAPCVYGRPLHWKGSDPWPGRKIRRIHGTTNPRFPRHAPNLDPQPSADSSRPRAPRD